MTGQWKVFINEPVDYEGATHRMLEERGCEVILGRPIWEHPGWRYTDEELIEACRDADAVMGASRESYTRKFMESAKRLRIISKYGIGVEKIDVQAATDHGILVANTPDTHNDTVAEHTIALILGLTKRLFFATQYARGGGWRDKNVETAELLGKTLGIVGMGRVGSEIAERLKGWKMTILAYDPYKPPEHIEKSGAIPVGLEQLLEESDIVSLHVVCNDETRGMIGEEQLRLMKRSSFIINTSRGEVLDEKSLIKALKEGWIGGAGLDVVYPEPPDTANPLFQMDNVILTPHIAGWSSEALSRFLNKAANNLLNALRGKLPESLVNPEAVPKWKARIEEIEQSRTGDGDQ